MKNNFNDEQNIFLSLVHPKEHFKTLLPTLPRIFFEN